MMIMWEVVVDWIVMRRNNDFDQSPARSDNGNQANSRNRHSSPMLLPMWMDDDVDVVDGEGITDREDVGGGWIAYSRTGKTQWD